MSDYLEFRGRCREMAEALAASNPNLTVVRGWYLCPVWGKQAHWWCVAADGTIHDPSVRQFPTQGAGAVYEPFNGLFECEFCGKEVTEREAYLVPPHIYCSYTCYGHDVGF